jgi:tetratricopeptide (TPR) repeat protein/predicted Ser/Thr protein kinase
MTSGTDSESRNLPEPTHDAEADLGSRLRREQVHAALFGEAKEPARVDRFVLLEPIGAGGMGELYTAYDAHLERKIALKLVRTGRGGGKADARLLREAQALARLSHPNVVSVYEVGKADDRVFVAMEYVRGQTLAAWLEQTASLPERRRVHDLLVLFRDAGRGLAAVHQAGIAHRDFKPDNVLVGDDGRVRVVDFGLARNTQDSTDERSVDVDDTEASEVGSGGDSKPDEVDPRTPDVEVGTLTATGTLLGTPRYMAPEQWRARRGDSRSDQFSFCVSLYFALYRRWPFEAATRPGLRIAVVGGELREPPRKAEVPLRLHAALLRGLATDPEQRWPDLSELLRAIDEALAARRRRPGAWLGAIALAMAATVATVLLIDRGSSRNLAVGQAVDRVERELAAERGRVRVTEQVAALHATGDHAEADAVFAAFAAVPQYAHTRALAQAWLDQAVWLHERGDASGELAALGEAQLASPSAEQRNFALMELARALVRGHRYAQLGATLDVLDEAAGDDDEPSLELMGMHVREAVSRRDFTSAIAWLGYPDAEPLAADLLTLLRQLERASPTDHVVPTLTDPRLTVIAALPSVDLDGDRRNDLLLAAGPSPVQVVGARPGLPKLHELDLRAEGAEGGILFRPVASASSRVGAPNLVLAEIGGERSLFELHGDETERLDAVAVAIAARGTQWVSGDLFAGSGWDGWEGIGAQTIVRRMIGLRRQDGVLQPFDPRPALDAQNSVIEEVAIADLDGDGDDELVAGVGAWWAYDVRVLEPDRADPGRFEPAARRKIGAMSGMISFPAPYGPGHWIAGTLPYTPPSPRVFPPEAPGGMPPGVVLLAWAGLGRPLEVVEHVPLPDSYRPSAGDLDGDGRSELVVQMHPPAIAVLHPTADGSHLVLWIDGVIHHGIHELDGDDDDELIVSDAATGRLMLLGTGDDRMPVLHPRAADSVEAPASLDRALAELWTRAETLARIGLVDQARSAFGELARLAHPGEAALAHRRSAELASRGGLRSEAATFYERADDPDSLGRAVELYEQIHAFTEAARVAERLAGHTEFDEAMRETWRTRAVVLHRRAEPEVALEFDFDEPLDERWRIARPGLLRREPGGLRVESLGAPDPRLLTRRIVWEGDRLQIELDLDLLRLEWGSQLRVALVPIDESGEPSGAAIVERSIGSWGGGDYYVLDFAELTPLEPGSHGEDRPMRGAMPPAGQHHFRLRIDLLAGSDRIWTTVTTLDESGPRDTAVAFERPVPPETLRPGRYALHLQTGIEPWVRGVVRLDRLQVLGARDDLEVAPATRRERVLLAMARGEDEQALELLEAPGDELEPRDAAWLRALTLEQLGRWSQAVPELEQAIADCREPDALARFGHAMLLQPDRFGPTLRSICSADRFLLATWAVTQTTVFQHKDLPDLHRTLTTQLIDLDHHEPGDLAQALATMGLLTSRARGWLMQDVASAAAADLHRVIALSGRWRDAASLTHEQRRDIRRIGSIAHVELAVVLMSRDQHDAAAAELDRALANDLAPEIIADVIAARPVFEPLHQSSLWSRVTSAQLGAQ